MRVVRTGQNHDDRRRIVVDMLQFIHDFNQFDTTRLILQAREDFKFVEAVEAVLMTAVGPWKSVEALRDFAVQRLTGMPPLPVEISERVRRRDRLSPFSVPYDLLRAIVPHRGQFDPGRLRLLVKNWAVELPRQAKLPLLYVPQDQWWLVTTMWARAVPWHPAYRHVVVHIHDEGTNRALYDGPLPMLQEEAQPCWWPIAPNSALAGNLSGSNEEPQMTLFLVIEGWMYLWQ